MFQNVLSEKYFQGYQKVYKNQMHIKMMDLKLLSKEIIIILFASFILGACYSYPNSSFEIIKFTIFFIIIIATNTIVKKIFAYNIEIDLRTKFWSIYHYGFKQGSHFVKPVYMIWLPVLLSLISRGMLFWIPILEFDVKALPERVSRKHGLYRFAQVTDWDIALIVMWGIISNLCLAIIAYIFGGYIPGAGTFAKLNIYYAIWSLIPISSLDGSKLFFGSRPLWFAMTVIVLLFLFFGISIVV